MFHRYQNIIANQNDYYFQTFYTLFIYNEKITFVSSILKRLRLIFIYIIFILLLKCFSVHLLTSILQIKIIQHFICLICLFQKIYNHFNIMNHTFEVLNNFIFSNIFYTCIYHYNHLN